MQHLKSMLFAVACCCLSGQARADALSLFVRGLERCTTIDTTLVVQEEGEASRKIRIVAQRPNRFFVDLGDERIRCDGNAISVLNDADQVRSSQPFSAESLRKAFLGSEYLWIWALFFDRDALQGFSVETLPGVPRGSKVCESVRIKRQGSACRIVFDPGTRLPLDYEVTTATALTVKRVRVATAAEDSKIETSIFGMTDSSSAGATNSAAHLNLAILSVPDYYLVPPSAEVAISGELPGTFRNVEVSSVKVSILVDGVVGSEYETRTPKWILTWKAPLTGKHAVVVVAKQGEHMETLHKFTATSTHVLPISVSSGNVRPDGSFSLFGDFAGLSGGTAQLTLGGEPVTFSSNGTTLTLRGDRLIPGHCVLQGHFQRSVDGAEFDLPEQDVTILPAVEVVLAVDKAVNVTRENLTTQVPLKITGPTGTPTGQRTWINGFLVAEGATPTGITYDNLFEGGNEIVLEVRTNAGTFWSAPVTAQAHLAVDVQRMRVSEVMFPVVQPLLTCGSYYVISMVLHRSPPEGVNLGAGMPTSRYADAVRLAGTYLSLKKIPKLPVTADIDFNAKASPFEEDCRAALDLARGILTKLSYASGEGGFIRRTAPDSVGATLRAMAQFFNDADADAKALAKTLTQVDAFMASYPDKKHSRLSEEAKNVKELRIVDENLDRVGYLTSVSGVISLLDGPTESMERFGSQLPAGQTSNYGGTLRRAVDLLVEAMKKRDAIVQWLEEISALKLALARENTKEGRAAIARKIAGLQQEVDEARRAVRVLEAKAWGLIEKAGVDSGLEVQGLAVVAPAMKLQSA